MDQSNVLFIFSDQHTRRTSGCYGHPNVATPNLDQLAEGGTLFNNAYTNCPICVPARASLATGRYVHQIRNWDNGFPYDGSIPSWHHRLREQEFEVTSVGKLHFKGKGSDHGFSEEVDPLHVVDGLGDILQSIRKDPPSRDKRNEILNAGPGDSTYLQYDQRNADNTISWLHGHAQDTKPWVLFSSFVCPHPPYIAPADLYERYAAQDLPFPPQWHSTDWPDHPAMDYLRRFFHYDEPFPETELHKLTATYYGVVSYLDSQIGRVLATLRELGLAETTRIIYSSDHGESLGARGLFGKFTMYEESVAVPFIMAGPDIPQGKKVNTPVSLVDCFPTILQAVGAKPTEDDSDLPGESLLPFANGADQERTVFSEYHALGTENSYSMVRDLRYKLIYHVHGSHQLFDLTTDPDEKKNLFASTEHQEVRKRLERKIRSVVNPEVADAHAKSNQTSNVEKHGGEEVVRRRGAFDNSPVPGETPSFRRHE